ncbi:MAG TPA: polyribonucleotide nucleotidyltransferase [Candidatus Paceibacterota bacterium]|nr:polyribonucleotide nucleotidyltransferase [Candidatus Paceibacterota bacterium]
MKTKEYSLEVGGRKVTATFSDLADQAHGSVLLKYGETVVLATACMSKEREVGRGFFNLTVDYVERFYAAGEILGSRFMRREGRPSDDAVLASRIIDRTIRPLFNRHFKHAVQVIVTVLSVGDADPAVLAINAASLALATSQIPWGGPVGAVQITKTLTSEIKINLPQKREIPPDDVKVKYNLITCGKENKITMIEASATEAKEEEIEEGLQTALLEISKLENWQKKITAEIGVAKHPVEKIELPPVSKELYDKHIAPRLAAAVFSGAGKKELAALHSEWNEMVKKTHPDRVDFATEDDHFDEAVNAVLHEKAVKEGKRPDGRAMTELRSLFAKAGGFSEITHGVGIFYRGGTHVLSVLTLAGPEGAHIIEGMETKAKKRFMHHYNFPPYSVGELGRGTFVGRREIGHGALAEKSFYAVLPDQIKFPYTIRVVSEALASNGSSSMGSVCGTTLALMDGGVPITRPVVGIAMGLMYENEKNYKVLTDIQGPEDHHGDMDFKIAATEVGVTALQLDIKLDGVSVPILIEALKQSRAAHGEILKVITATIAAPRPELAKTAPRVLSTKINKDMIGMVIGSGGKTINAIRDETGAEITIEEDGTIFVSGKNGGAERALQIIEEMTHEYKIGEKVIGEVVNITDFGAFVKLNQATEGLVHISEIAPFRVGSVGSVLKVGDKVPVIVIPGEPGKVKLSIKQVDPTFIKETDESKQQPKQGGFAKRPERRGRW